MRYVFALFLLLRFAQCVSVIANATQLAAITEILRILNEDFRTLQIVSSTAQTDLCAIGTLGSGMITCDSSGEIVVFHAPARNLKGNLGRIDWSPLRELNYINLAQNNLYGTIPQSLRSLTNIQFIYLQRNQLRGPLLSALQPSATFALSLCQLVSPPIAQETNCFTDPLDASIGTCASSVVDSTWPCYNTTTSIATAAATTMKTTALTAATTTTVTSVTGNTSSTSSSTSAAVVSSSNNSFGLSLWSPLMIATMTMTSADTSSSSAELTNSLTVIALAAVAAVILFGGIVCGLVLKCYCKANRTTRGDPSDQQHVVINDVADDDSEISMTDLAHMPVQRTESPVFDAQPNYMVIRRDGGNSFSKLFAEQRKKGTVHSSTGLTIYDRAPDNIYDDVSATLD